MQFLIGVYSIAYLFFWITHDWAIAFLMFCYSCFLAALPFTNSWVPWAIAAAVAIKFTFFPYDDNFDFDFVAVAVLFVPFSYIAVADSVINLVRAIFNRD
jgi:hypothetical protein